MDKKFDNKLKCGLWKKEVTFEDDKGVEEVKKVLNGVVTVGNDEYYVNIYYNDNKTESKQPDFTMYLKPKIAKQEPAKSDLKDFGDTVESEDDEW